MVKIGTGVHPSVFLPERRAMLSILAIACQTLAVLIVAGGRTVERQYDAVMRVLERPAV
jgi:hypothetical protein